MNPFTYLENKPETGLYKYLRRLVEKYPPERTCVYYSEDAWLGFDAHDETPEHSVCLALSILHVDRDGKAWISFTDADDWTCTFEFGNDIEAAQRFMDELNKMEDMPMSMKDIYIICLPFGGICEWGDLTKPNKKKKI